MTELFPNKARHGNRKKAFFQLSWQQLLKGKVLHQRHESCRYRVPLTKLI